MQANNPIYTILFTYLSNKKVTGQPTNKTQNRNCCHDFWCIKRVVICPIYLSEPQHTMTEDVIQRLLFLLLLHLLVCCHQFVTDSIPLEAYQGDEDCSMKLGYLPHFTPRQWRLPFDRQACREHCAKTKNNTCLMAGYKATAAGNLCFLAHYQTVNLLERDPDYEIYYPDCSELYLVLKSHFYLRPSAQVYKQLSKFRPFIHFEICLSLQHCTAISFQFRCT